jgi:hypothetical protein
MRPPVNSELHPARSRRPERIRAQPRDGEDRAAEERVECFELPKFPELVVGLMEVVESPRSLWHHLLESPHTMNSDVASTTQDDQILGVVVEWLFTVPVAAVAVMYD